MPFTGSWTAKAALENDWKSLLCANFQLLRDRASQIGVWVVVDPIDRTLEFHPRSAVENEPEWSDFAKAFSDSISEDNRASKKDLLVYFPDSIELEVKKNKFAIGKAWWVKKRSSACTFIKLDSTQAQVDAAAAAKAE